MTGDYTDTFEGMPASKGAIRRSKGPCKGGECADEVKAPSKRPTPSLPNCIERLVTGICKAYDSKTGKPWIVEEGYELGDCGNWKPFRVGVCELPFIYKPGQVDEEGEPISLPDFNGTITVNLANGTTQEIIGGEPLPQDMIGVVFCIGGELCYQAANVDEVYIGADPAPGGTKLWIDTDNKGLPKAPLGNDGEFVQLTNYGA